MKTENFASTHSSFNLCLSVFICGISCFPLTISVLADEPPLLESATFFELRGGLSNARIVFEGAGQGRVAFLGGSLTQMTGWRDLVCENLRSRFPNTEFDFVQAGVASMGSTPGSFRIARDVFRLGSVDLLFVEAAVNDSTNHRTSIEQIRGMEGIVRHARTINPNIDIILLHFVDPDKMKSYNAGQTPEVIANHERVAEHYQLPSINLAREVTARIAAGEFTWKDDFKNLHPAPFGHQVYLNSIQRLFDLAWADTTSTTGEIAVHPLPEMPLDPFSYTNGHIVSINAAKDLDRFTVVENWQPSDGKGTRPGFVNVPMLSADTPGASLRIEFEGTAIGLWVAASPDAGVIEFQIDGGPVQRVDLFTDWSGGLHLPWAYILGAELTRSSHTLEVQIVTPNPERKHGGNAVRIAHFLVNR